MAHKVHAVESMKLVPSGSKDKIRKNSVLPESDSMNASGHESAASHHGSATTQGKTIAVSPAAGTMSANAATHNSAAVKPTSSLAPKKTTTFDVVRLPDKTPSSVSNHRVVAKMPTKRTSIETSRESSAMRRSIATEFSIFLKLMEEVAIHYVTLYFVNMTSSAVITKMEQSFTKYYANAQRKLYARGLAALVVFMISTIAYDYLMLNNVVSFSTATNQATTSTSTSSSTGSGTGSSSSSDSTTILGIDKFTFVVSLKLLLVIPVLVATMFRARKRTYPQDFWLTWICLLIVALYPLVYNKLTDDYGVSWVCLFIMYTYSCTPIRFFPCSVFCLLYLVLYVVVMLAFLPSDTSSSTSSASSSSSSSSSTRTLVSNETLYACLFYFLILLPSQSREFAIRVSYMSELMVLLQQEQLKMEETRSKFLLNSMLPESVVYQLQSGRELIADEYPQATVLFAEVCDFDTFSSKLKPQHVVELLNIIFSKFDKLVDLHQVHKVETIGAVRHLVPFGILPTSASVH